jgi:hypothetical protein
MIRDFPDLRTLPASVCTVRARKPGITEALVLVPTAPTAILRSATWMMPRGSLKTFGTNRPILAQLRAYAMESRSQFLWQKNATDPEPRHPIKYASFDG